MNGTATNESDASEILARLNKEQAIIMIPSTILVIITMFVGMIGNSLTCYVYGFRLKMTPTYLFVVMLAVVDLITCVIITPGRIIQNIVPLMTTWDGFCKNHMVLSVFTGLSTCGFLVAIAADRYRKMCSPLKTQLSMKGAKIITTVICLFCAIQGGIVTLYYGSVKKPTTIAGVFGYSCSAKIMKTVNYYQLGFFASYMLVTLFTIISLTVCYSIVLHTMKKIVNKNKTVVQPPSSKAVNLRKRLSNAILLRLKADPDSTGSTSSNNNTTMTDCGSTNTLEDIVTDTDENSSSVISVQPTSSSGVSSGTAPSDNERQLSPKELTKQETRTRSLKRAEENMQRLNRTTVTMMMITAVFVVTFIPSISAMMVNAAVKAEQKMGTAAAIFYWFARSTFYISSCLNPVIYGFRNKNFMDETRQLFRRFRRN